MMVILSSKVCSYSQERCSGHVQKIALFVDNSNSVKVDRTARGDLIVKRTSGIYYLYQITLKPGYVTWYDPNAQMFICWNKTFKKLIPKKKTKFFRPCLMTELPANVSGMVSYNSMKPGVQMVFPQMCSGVMSKRRKAKLRHPKHPKCHTNFLPKYDPSSDACVSSELTFCYQMRQNYKKKVPPEICSVCCGDVDVNCMFPECRT